MMNLFHVGWFTSAVAAFVLKSLVTGTGFAGFVWSSVWSGLWLLGSFQGVWHNVFWETELFSEVGDTFVGQGPVVVLPGVVLLDESSGFEALESFHDVKVSDFGVGVG